MREGTVAFKAIAVNFAFLYLFHIDNYLNALMRWYNLFRLIFIIFYVGFPIMISI
jgi:hypothetical protein